MKKILTYFKPYKWQSFLGPLFKLLEATFELLVPFVVGLIVDKGLGERVNGGYPYADKGYIVLMCLVLAGFCLFGFIFAVLAQYFAARTATGVSADVRKDLFRKIQALSYKDIDKIGTSTLLTRMTSDVDKLQSGVNLFLRLFLRSPFIVFGAMVMGVIIEKAVFPVFAVAILALAIVVYAIMFISMPLYKKTQAKLDDVLLSTRENLTGARVLRAFCREDEEQELFDERNEKLTVGRRFADGISAITNPLTFVLVNLATIWLIYTGAIRVESGALSQGQVLALYNLMGQILIELIKLANLIVTVTKAVACANRIETVLALTPSILTTEGSERVENAPFIRFENVSMTYNKGAENALSDISFDVEKGQTVGVIGGTGSGKTTLMNLLLHFYDVDGGRVLLEGVNVNDKAVQRALIEKIGIVPQKAALVKGSIRENLLWGNPFASDEELYKALKIAQAKEIVDGKGGLDSKIEQGGKNLSGGQKQRLTIARALVKNPQILILDDSSSALDYATDLNLRREIKKLDTTTFIVSQRASSVCEADKILVLDEGRLVGVGKHEELLRSCEVYKEIYLSQYKDGEGKAV